MPNTPQPETTRSLAEAVQEELKRVRVVRDHCIALRGLPQCNPEFAIAMIDQTINQTVKALAEGDCVALLRCYEELKNTED